MGWDCISKCYKYFWVWCVFNYRDTFAHKILDFKPIQSTTSKMSPWKLNIIFSLLDSFSGVYTHTQTFTHTNTHARECKRDKKRSITCISYFTNHQFYPFPELMWFFEGMFWTHKYMYTSSIFEEFSQNFYLSSHAIKTTLKQLCTH